MAFIVLNQKQYELKFTYKSLLSLEKYFKKPIADVFQSGLDLENLNAVLWACLQRESDFRGTTIVDIETLLDTELEATLDFDVLNAAITQALDESVILKKMKAQADRLQQQAELNQVAQ
ncbi:tail assembly chaperone [Ectobacillus ponti]|uniref:Tail assembly chaperone n=1 Tax=Ectobacillus ponti TaxID=2961894 RepID=A0AA42BUI8_9BACI|nr:tail assembly chaperone [Ectobacillus ponti]MCP8970573.1 tail assembly chaperone [Ectobacillus ponti]